MPEKPRKFKLHFNRINMQRGNPNVWTIHFSNQCVQVEHVVVLGSMHTVFKPGATQPRAFFSGRGVVTVEGNTATLRSAL
jgi:hypothetical protein